MQLKSRTTSLENLPHLLQHANVAYDASVVHVPLVVHWVQSGDLVHEPVDATTEVKRAQRIALLHAPARPDHMLMIVEQHRSLTVARLRPVGHRRKHLAHAADKVIALDLIERVAEVNLEKPELRTFVLLKCVAQRMGHNLNSSGATDAVVAALKS